MNERTVGGLLAYADWLRDKGYQSKNAITAWKVAVDKVFRAVDGEDFASTGLDADLDDYMRRFQTLVGADYKAETISVYGKRIRNAIEAHEYYLEHGKPPAFRTGVRKDNGDGKPKAKAAPKPKAAKSPQAPKHTPPLTGDLIVFPFPLRGGQMAEFHLPASGVTPGDADRISAFVRTLSFAEQQQIPRKTGEDEEQQAA